ncbi:peptidylprolyl isomerase [Tenacibaculum sp. M341]|uniref:peptidylprolyl isomerase n=1 Tax=Tenacibaculum sp. M341 TaxID=2530339 RepID=UPI0010453E04|nr:peptidylprolyl isomerase [Tenacibaculum sp. M341]TCI90714.1 peptidylprolyl isomerase [Tenacibaculum sp. M341]
MFHKTSIFLILVAIITFVSCNEEKKQVPKKKVEKVAPIKKVEKKIKKVKEKEVLEEWDTLDRTNVDAFFTKYGELNKETKVLITTKFGKIKLRLFNDTPIHRANFIFLTKIKYFNTAYFYRVAKNFVVQAGDSDKSETARIRGKYQHYRLKPEIRKRRRHKYGSLAAAKDVENNPKKLSSPFNFYIVQNKKGAPHLDKEHTVFGEVISGFSTIEKIAKVEVGSDDWPLEDIPMTVEVIN